MTNIEQGPISLQTKMALLLAVYLAGVYLICRILGSYTGVREEYLLLGFVFVFLMLLNLGGPALLERRMRVRWLGPLEEPRIVELVRRFAGQANLSEPRIGESSLTGANAFTFGRTKRDARICFTRQLLADVNDDELGAVIAHELSHVRNWDGTIVTLLSVVPILSQALVSIPRAITREAGWLPSRLFFLAVAVLLTPVVWLGWLALIPVNWFATLLLNYGSRVRELNADRDAVEFGVNPHDMASVLYKLSKSEPDPAGGQLIPAKPLLLATGPLGYADSVFFQHLDADQSGDISFEELGSLRERRPSITLPQLVGELFSPHPLLEKRLRRLAVMM
jgi:heat shock protein HtpX